MFAGAIGVPARPVALRGFLAAATSAVLHLRKAAFAVRKNAAEASVVLSGPMAAFLMDLRHASRVWRQSPWYVATIVGVLAVGIALTTVTFAVVDGILFKPLPFPQAHELYLVHADVGTAPRTQPPQVSWRDTKAWLEAAPELRITVLRNDPRSGDAAVDERFFDVLGIQPFAGGFAEADFDWFAEVERSMGRRRIRPVLISHRTWMEEYGGDWSVVGSTVIVTDRAGAVSGKRIAGILPRDFVFPLDVGAAQPREVAPIAASARDGADRDFHVIARVSRADVVALSQRLTTAVRALPEAPEVRGHAPAERMQQMPFDRVELVPLDMHLARHVRPAFALVFAGAGVLLLLACVNVASLVGARSVERRRDIAVRRALGAGTWPLVRGLLAETLLLATVATGLALLVSRPLLLWTLALLPPTVSLLKEAAIDGRVFAIAALLSVLTACAIAMWPARAAACIGVTTALSRVDGSATRRVRRTTMPLVATQVALAFVLLTAGALTISSLARAWRNDTGYQRERMILLEAYVMQAATRDEMTEQFAAIPSLLSLVDGVDRVAVSTVNRFFAELSTAWSDLSPQGWRGPVEGVRSRAVSGNFFDVMGVRLVDGRWPSESEWRGMSAAIVSESAARTMWPGRSAVGQLLVGQRGKVRVPVIAVVADTRFGSLDETPEGQVYVPDNVSPGRYGAFFHVRTTAPAESVLPRLVSALAGRGILLEQASTHEDALFASIRHRALPAWLFGSLGFGALVIVGAGVLGLLAMTAAQRTRELGIRVALGATRARVVRMLLREQLVAVATGIAAGSLISAWTVHYLESQLYAVDAYDPSTWLLVAVSLVAVAALGTLIPSLRASRADPVSALRAE